jgi:tetratricopeptide (TPR) repeat protein
LITTERISDWLREPHQLQEVAPRALLQFAKAYPYFLPAHYFKHVALQQDEARLVHLQSMYRVNPVLLREWLEAAAAEPLPLQEEEAITETIPANDAMVDQAVPAINEAAEEANTTGSTTGPPAQTAARQHPEKEDLLAEIMMQPAADDYFMRQGIEVSSDIPEMKVKLDADDEKSLMVVMSFTEWLGYISAKSKKAREEEEDQKALKTMWQKQKLAAALEEESEEIPEQVFEMAVNSIAREDELVSESLAEVYARQGKVEKAIEMYRKLSLLNPEKNTYFAAKIENIQKDL